MRNNDCFLFFSIYLKNEIMLCKKKILLIIVNHLFFCEKGINTKKELIEVLIRNKQSSSKSQLPLFQFILK